MVAQCQQHSHTGSHKLLTGNGKPSTAAPGQADGCLLHRATHSQFAGIHPSPQQVPSLRILGIVLLSTSIQGSSEDLQRKGGCSGLSEQRVISTEGVASACCAPSHLPNHSQLTSHIWEVTVSQLPTDIRRQCPHSSLLPSQHRQIQAVTHAGKGTTAPW